MSSKTNVIRFNAAVQTEGLENEAVSGDKNMSFLRTGNFAFDFLGVSEEMTFLVVCNTTGWALRERGMFCFS